MKLMSELPKVPSHCQIVKDRIDNKINNYYQENAKTKSEKEDYQNRINENKEMITLVQATLDEVKNSYETLWYEDESHCHANLLPFFSQIQKIRYCFSFEDFEESIKRFAKNKEALIQTLKNIIANLEKENQRYEKSIKKELINYQNSYKEIIEVAKEKFGDTPRYLGIYAAAVLLALSYALPIVCPVKDSNFLCVVSIDGEVSRDLGNRGALGLVILQLVVNTTSIILDERTLGGVKTIAGTLTDVYLSPKNNKKQDEENDSQ
jgi:hypothetical protein